MLEKKIIFGTASLNLEYGINSRKERTNSDTLLELIFNNNIHYFDTALEYNNDKLIGEFLKKFNFKAKIYTKGNIFGEFDSFVKSFEIHIKNLGKIPEYFLIRSHNSLKKNNVYKTLRYFSENFPNMIIGASIYDQKDYSFFNEFDISIIQYPHNLINEFNLIKKKNATFIVRSIFLQGLLTINNNISLNNKKLNKYLNDFNNDYFLFLKEKNINPIDLCMSNMILNKSIDKFIISTNNISQFKEIIEFKTLNKDLIDEVKLFLFNYEKKFFDPRLWI